MFGSGPTNRQHKLTLYTDSYVVRGTFSGPASERGATVKRVLEIVARGVVTRLAELERKRRGDLRSGQRRAQAGRPTDRSPAQHRRAALCREPLLLQRGWPLV